MEAWKKKKCQCSRDNCRRECRVGRVNWSRAARLVGPENFHGWNFFASLERETRARRGARFSRDLTRRVKSPLTLEDVGGWKALFHPRGEDSRIRRDVSAEISLNGWITEKRARRKACNNRNRGSEYAKMLIKCNFFILLTGIFFFFFNYFQTFEKRNLGVKRGSYLGRWV